VDKAMNKEKSKEILLEISELRDSMHKLFDKNKKVTEEVLHVSTQLDQRINSYFKLSNGKSY
jgi:hypothetical protein